MRGCSRIWTVALFVAIIAAISVFCSCQSVTVERANALHGFEEGSQEPYEDSGESPFISVTNNSVVTMMADTVSFTVTVRQRGDDADSLTDSGNKRVGRVRSALKAIGIEDVTTQNFSVSPFYSYIMVDKDKSPYDRENERKEYEYHEYLHSLRVKIEGIDKSPELPGLAIDSILAVDDVEISDLSFSISDNRKANSAARRSSAQAVMRKIHSYAQGSQVEVKGIRFMREGAFTRDTGTVMSKAAGASRNVYALAAANLEAQMEDVADEDGSTMITSDKIDINAEVSYAATLAGEEGDGRVFVSGFSQIKASPDIARFSITVTLEGEKPSKLAAEVADIVRGVSDRLDGECDITTDFLNITPVFKGYDDSSSAYHPDRANRMDGYECSHVIVIEVRDFDKDNRLGRVIDLAKANFKGISIGGISYSLSDNTPFADKARSGAAANGKEKCEIYASGAGVKTSGVFSISENYSAQDTAIDGDPLYYGGTVKKRYGAGDIAQFQTVIFPGRISVHAQLTVTASI